MGEGVSARVPCARLLQRGGTAASLVPDIPRPNKSLSPTEWDPPRSRMTAFSPFSSGHMALVRPLPASSGSRLRAASAWLEIALPRIEAHARRRAWRRGVDAQDIDDVVAAVLLRIHERVLDGDYADLIDGVAALQQVQDHVDHCIRAHVRRARRDARAVQPMGTAAERVPRVGAEPTDAWMQARVARAEAGLIRDLPGSPVRRLIILLHVHPEELRPDDLARAVAASRTELRGGEVRQLGLTRGLPELQARLATWLPRGPELPETRRGSRRRAVLRQWLAWILRGPPGSTDIGCWSDEDAQRGLNWLDQQQSRGRAALRAALESVEPGSDPTGVR